MKYFILALVFFSCIMTANSQCFSEKRIYLVDVTKSMIGQGKGGTDNIFNILKENLSCAIMNISCDDAEVVIIPFTNRTFDPIKGVGAERDKLSESIRRMTVRHGDTNILDAWRAGLSEIDSTKINFLFLLTDGIHNYGDPIDSLYSNILKWDDDESIHDFNRNHFFYVMLTENAESNVIRNIARNRNTIQVVRPENMDVDFTVVPLKTHYYINVFDSKSWFITPQNCTCGEPRVFNNVEMYLDDNPYYEIDQYSVYFSTDTIRYRIKCLKEQRDLPTVVTSRIHFKWSSEEHPLLFVMPKASYIRIENRGVRKVIVY